MATAVPKGLEYSEYMKLIAPYLGEGGGGDAGFTAGNPALAMSEEEWNALPSAEKYRMFRDQGGSRNTGVGSNPFDPTADDADTTRFRQKFGDPGWGNKSGRDGDNRVLWGYGDLPTIYGASPEEYMIDPSRVVRDADGRWMIEANNIKGDWLAHAEKNRDRTFNRKAWQTVVKLGAAAVGGYYGGGGVGVNEGIATTPVPEAVGGGTAATGGGTVAAATPTSGYEPFEANYPGNAPINPTPVPTTPQPAATDYVPGGSGTQAPAQVSTAGTSGAPVTDLSVPATQPGIIDSVRNGVSGAWDWYNKLGPAARLVVNTGVSAGVQGLMGANAQRTASQAADEEQRRAEQDRIRRSNVQSFTSGAFTPKPKGIINSNRKGG